MPLRGWLRKRMEDVKEEARVLKDEENRFSVGTPKKIIVLPDASTFMGYGDGKSDAKKSIDITYELIPPFAYARLHWNEAREALEYEVIQPVLFPKEAEIIKLMQSGLTKKLQMDITVFKGSNEALKYIQKEVTDLIEEEGIHLDSGQYTRIMYYIYINFVGLNQIEPLMHDSYIEDIGCDGVDVPIYITHKKYGNIRTNIVYKDINTLQEFVIKLAERAGRYISYAEPLLDGSLPDGSRVQATLTTDVTTRGPTYSIRKFREIPYSAVDLIRMNTASSEVMAYLWLAIEHKSNILICGGTGAGKTSFLNSLVSFIPPEDKIVSIEDTREINLPHENWIPAVARTGFGTVTKEGVRYGEISMFDLLKESFRQRPDYVIVGEVRGVEASVLFQGMASGHPSLGTIHGGSVEDIIKRMETPPISLPPSLLESLDIVIVITHADQFGKSARRVKETAEIESIDPESGRARTVKSFQWSPVSDRFERKHSVIIEQISAEYGIPLFKLEEEIRMRQMLLEWLLKNKVFNFRKVSEYIAEYYRNKENVLKEITAKEKGKAEDADAEKAENVGKEDEDAALPDADGKQKQKKPAKGKFSGSVDL